VRDESVPPRPADEPLLISEEMLEPRVTTTDFERGMRYAPPVTLSMIAILVVVYRWQVSSGALVSAESIVAAGALARDRVLAGEWWRMVTAGFLHGSADHLIGNCISLYILGIACEHAIGARAMLAVYGVSLLAGSAVSMALGPGPGVGASGAIFGIMGAIIVFLHRYRTTFHLRDTRIGFVVAIWAGYTLLLGAVNPMVDNGAHLGGLIGGALAVLATGPREALLEARTS